jgi:hypothetical protein
MLLKSKHKSQSSNFKHYHRHHRHHHHRHRRPFPRSTEALVEPCEVGFMARFVPYPKNLSSNLACSFSKIDRNCRKIRPTEDTCPGCVAPRCFLDMLKAFVQSRNALFVSHAGKCPSRTHGLEAPHDTLLIQMLLHACKFLAFRIFFTHGGKCPSRTHGLKH